MLVEHMIAFNIALLAAIASPGPALLVAIRTSISQGFWSGITMGCGLGLMASLWTLFALLGLDVLFNLFPYFYTVAKIIGAIYLAYLGWGMWKGAAMPLEDKAVPSLRAFRDGLLVNLSNPKSVLFAAAVLVVIFPAELSLIEKGIVALNHFVFEVIFYSLVALVMSSDAMRRLYLGLKLYLDRFAGVVMGVLAVRILFLGERR